MSILHRLASQQDRKDQNPNKDLAHDIIKSQDHEAIAELNGLLTTKDKNILFDVLKTLEVIGENDANLIKDLFDDLVPLINHKINKIVWITMSVFCHVTSYHPEKTYKHLARIIQIMDEGSVITRDKGFKILAELYADPRHQSDCQPLIVEQLLKAPDNQFGMYTEKWMEVITKTDVSQLIKILEQRMPELSSPSHIMRAERNLKKLNKMKI